MVDPAAVVVFPVVVALLGAVVVVTFPVVEFAGVVVVALLLPVVVAALSLVVVVAALVVVASTVVVGLAVVVTALVVVAGAVVVVVTRRAVAFNRKTGFGAAPNCTLTFAHLLPRALNKQERVRMSTQMITSTTTKERYGMVSRSRLRRARYGMVSRSLHTCEYLDGFCQCTLLCLRFNHRCKSTNFGGQRFDLKAFDHRDRWKRRSSHV